MAKQVYNVSVMMNFLAGSMDNQKVEAKVFVPFPVGKIVFHPPVSNATADLADGYSISTAVADNKVVGVLTISGMVPAVPVKLHFNQPKQFAGMYQFQLKSFTEIAGGAGTAIALKVYQMLEFHEF